MRKFHATDIAMDFQQYIDTDLQCAFIRFEGEIHFIDIRKQLGELTALPGHKPEMKVLLDLSLATLPQDFDMANIKKVVESRPEKLDEGLGKNRLVAWVVGNANDFKLVHQFFAMTRLNFNVVNRRSFRNINAAMKWLDLPDNYEFRYPQE